MKVDRLISIDLTPAPRRLVRQRRQRWRRWGVMLGLYALVLALVCLLLLSGQESRQAALAEEGLQVDSRLAAARDDLAELRRQWGELDTALASARALREQPDWTVVMVVLAEQLGPEVVLETCTLKATADAPSGFPADPTTTFVLSLAGHARTQKTVWGYALRLEKTGLFRSVRLLGTVDEAFLDGRAVEFRMECTLDGKGPTE